MFSMLSTVLQLELDSRLLVAACRGHPTAVPSPLAISAAACKLPSMRGASELQGHKAKKFAVREREGEIIVSTAHQLLRPPRGVAARGAGGPVLLVLVAAPR